MKIEAALANVYDYNHFLKYSKLAWKKKQSNSDFIRLLYDYAFSSYASALIVFLHKYIMEHHWHNSNQFGIDNLKQRMIKNIKIGNFVGNNGFDNVMEDKIISGNWLKKDHTEISKTDTYNLLLSLRSTCKHVLAKNWPTIDFYILPQLKGFYQTESASGTLSLSVNLPKASQWLNYHHAVHDITGTVNKNIKRGSTLYHTIIYPNRNDLKQYRTISYQSLLDYIKYAISRAEKNQSIKSVSAWC